MRVGSHGLSVVALLSSHGGAGEALWLWNYDIGNNSTRMYKAVLIEQLCKSARGID